MADRRRSIATVCLSGTLGDRLDAAAAAGFDGVEIFENDLIVSPAGPAAIAARVRDLGLAIDLYQPFRDAEGAPAERFAAVERRMRHKLDLMARLGAGLILICSSVAPDTIDDDDLAAEQLHRLADLAADRGIRIAYEALAWGRHVSTWQHSWRIVQKADHPALGLCLDSFHVLSRTSRFTDIGEVPAGRIFFLQLADAPRLSMDVLQWSRHHRLFPLQGAFDLAGFTAAVESAGYAGPLSLEVFNDVFRQADPHRTAVDAMRSLIALEDSIAARTGAPSVLEPAPTLSGIAFVELGVEAHTQPQLQRTLSALGFAPSGRHRSKPVELWQQGEARILLNAGAGHTGADNASASVRAFALESSDPVSSARRAARLCATAVPRTRGPDEADLSAVLAPDGTQVYFCRTVPYGQRGWLDDFVACEPARSDGTITGIDHLTLAQPFDRFDEAHLFYRSVLGLRDDEAAEYAAPFGLLRSLALRDPVRRVRLALSVPVLRRGDWGPAVPHPQHVTFATSDIERVARALHAAGTGPVPIPENYYDDLDSRFDLAPALSALVRRIDAMYDKDEHGAYLHLVTPVLGGQVFFEIAQRVSGYTGYGTPNVPVRMAAHRAQREPADTAHH
jgi:4-hydroxyphenylpyruvate dioxygenase